MNIQDFFKKKHSSDSTNYIVNSIGMYLYLPNKNNPINFIGKSNVKLI